MLTLFIRCVITYVLLLIIMRLMGKRQLSELQPFEFVITLIIADIGVIPMTDTGIPLAYGIVPMIVLFMLHLTFTKFSANSLKLSRLINGKPFILMSDKGIDAAILKKLDMNVNDFLYALRSEGYYYLEDIAFVIMETNGKLSILTKEDLKKSNQQSKDDDCVPYPIICNGKVLYNNLDQIKRDKQAVFEILNKEKIKEEEVLLLMLTAENEYYLQPIKGEAVTSSQDV